MDLFNGLEDVLKAHAEKTAAEIRRNLDWTKNLKNNIVVVVKDNSYTIGMPLYAIFIEKGRKANSKMPPSSALTGWLEAKGIPLDAAFNIARSIGKKGIVPRPFIDKSFDKVALLKDIAYLIGSNLAKEIEQKYGNK